MPQKTGFVVRRMKILYRKMIFGASKMVSEASKMVLRAQIAGIGAAGNTF